MFTEKMWREIFPLYFALLIPCLPNMALAVTYTVDNLATDTDDGNYAAGQLTLREAINLANASAGTTDIINFNYGVAGPYTVNLIAALPALTDIAGVTINGFSNPGAAANLIPVFNVTSGTPMSGVYEVILSNSTGIISTGLVLSGDYNLVQGLVLQNFGDGTPSTNDIAITITGNHNQVIGCYIGIDAGGTTGVAYTGIGISISGNNNTIGDGTAAGANLISGMNGIDGGIRINGAATGNVVRGNIIGLQKDGATKVANPSRYGIDIMDPATGNTIGGTGVGEGNVISGHSQRGIYTNSLTGTNYIFGNYIGTQADGATMVASNAQKIGIYIGVSPGNVIGSSTGRNIISGNNDSGIEISGNCTGTTIKGNYIGLNKTGTTVVASSDQDRGIYVRAVTGLNIGGSLAGEGNVISGNSVRGIDVENVCPSTTIKGNYIGPQANGASVITTNSQDYGIYLGGTFVTIGGSSGGEGNVISGNTFAGILASGFQTSNTIKGNYIGLDKNGTTFLTSNPQEYGIYLTGISSLTLGGSAAGEGNIISGNNTYGIYATGGFGSNVVIGNYIGSQLNGTAIVASSNQDYGIYLSGATLNIGGSSTAGEGNLISGNTTTGIVLTGASSNNTIKGNYIGVDKNGTAALPNTTDGINITGTSSSNTIGGTAAGEANIIANNGDNGIDINSASADFNLITRNSFFCNSGKAINLNYSGTPGNNAEPAPIIVTSLITGATGTAANNATVELYYNHGCSGCQGKTYVTTVTADGSGNWSYAGALTSGAQLLATSTSTTNNTSEFSTCSVPLPIELISFTARKINDRKVLAQWTTETETNNDYFTLEKNKNGTNWQSFGTVKGAGNSSQKLNYSFIDEYPFSEVSYYRLKQTDFDGTYSYSTIIPVEFKSDSEVEFSIYPNPAKLSVHNKYPLTLSGLNHESPVLVVLYDLIGKEFYSKVLMTTEGGQTEFLIESSEPLPPGIYLIKASANDKLLSKKVVVE